MIISDWWYAIKVCRKYGIRWNPFFKMTHAQIDFSYWDFGKGTKTTISINPFYEKFLDSFLHEVGHYICWRKALSESEEKFQQFIGNTLLNEYKAWQFSKLVLKHRFDKPRARSMFKTYFPVQAKAVGCVQAADDYYKFDRRIEK